MGWSLFEEKTGKDKIELKPKTFSNGKTQEDIVNEVVSEINKGTKIVFIHGVCGSGKCLEKNTRIFCKPNGIDYFGYYPISQLVGKEGVILSLDKMGHIVEGKFTKVVNSGKKKLYEIKTRTGRNLQCSINHPFLTITRRGLEWLPLEKLNRNSYICLPNIINLKNRVSLDKNKIKVLAHLIAEGKLGDKNGSPKYYQNPLTDLEVRLDYENALKKLFPDGQLRSSSPCEVTMVFNNRDTRFGTTNKLRLLIREFGLDGGKSGDKFVPPIIFNLNDADVALFLKTLFSGDGTIYEKNSHARVNSAIIVEYCSISKKLIQDVSVLLMRFGIQHTITPKKFREDKKYSWTIHISNQRQVRKFIENIGFIGRKQVFAEKVLGNLQDHKFTNIDKVPRIIREYLKDRGYNYNDLHRFLNYSEFEKFKGIGFKKILKKKLVSCPFVFRQKNIDFLREHINKINEHIKDNILEFICREDIIWDRLDKTEFIGEDETYDLEVPQHHNFIAEGIIVHNSAIALNVARELGKTSIVVPIKNLQRQYENDYMHQKHVLKKDGKKLAIAMITGRRNHICPYLEDNRKDILQTRIREKNSNLFEVFSDFKEGRKLNSDSSCDSPLIPCKIEIKSKNIATLKKYYTENPERKDNSELDIGIAKRFAIAPACPYWSPILPVEMKIKNEWKKKEYNSVAGKHALYIRKEGCPYYQQFSAYADSDVIIFNGDQYLLETALGRKPKTEVEIIDECDEFLDNFALEGTINLTRLRMELSSASNEDSQRKLINSLDEDVMSILNESREHLSEKDKILELEKTKVSELIKTLVKSDVFEIMNEDSYLEHCLETARKFYEVMGDSFVNFYRDKNKGDVFAKLVTINLDKLLASLIEKNRAFVFMSGTLHSERVLTEIFGLKNFKTIEAETFNLGTIKKLKTGLEQDFKFDNFEKGRTSREQYLKALDKCVEIAKIPILVHVSAFSDLPSTVELEQYKLKNLISFSDLMEQQNSDREGGLVRDFKSGKVKILFTTRCNRGIDFPFETCNSVVITKFPYPNTQSLFWKILKKNKPDIFWDFYKDKAHRELLQKVYRSVRAVDDSVFLLSPDIRVLNSQVV